MLRLLKRYNELLVVGALLVLPFIYFLGRGHKGRDPNAVDRAVVGLTSPIEGALTWTVDGAVDAWKGYVWLRGVREENLALATDNARLSNEVHALEEIRQENDRLRRMLRYVDTLSGAGVAARVVGVNPDPNNPSLRINRGEADGVVKGMAVVTPEGVVGQIQRATEHAADVLLLEDPKSRVGVRVQRTRTRGLAVVDGSDRSLRLEYALRTETVVDDDLVVTSGADGIFPPGLVIGKLTHVDMKGRGSFLLAEILPAVDTTKVEEVLIVPSTVVPAAAPAPDAGASLTASSPLSGGAP